MKVIEDLDIGGMNGKSVKEKIISHLNDPKLIELKEEDYRTVKIREFKDGYLEYKSQLL